MINWGRVSLGTVLSFMFTTYDGATGASEEGSGLAVTDIEIYKAGGGLTQRASDAGYALLDADGHALDSIVELGGFTVDTGDNTDAGFFVAGGYYIVVVSSITVDAVTVNFIAGTFSLGPTLSVAGVEEVDLTHIAGAAVSTSTAQLGVNAVQAGGTAWGSGAITAAAIATGAIDADALAADASTEINAAVLAVLGALADAASDGAVTSTDTMVAYLKQLINTLEGTPGIPVWPTSVAPGNAVSIAEAVRFIYDQLVAITAVTGAGGLATKASDSATLITGTEISGGFADTASDNDVYWITAPVTPAVDGFGLRQQLVFNLPLGRTPVSLVIRGYWNGSGQVTNVFALNQRTAVFDQLTNTGTNLASRNTETIYSIPLPRDYSDDSGGAFNIVTLEFRTASVNTAHRLRLDQVLVAHVAEDVAATVIAPTAEQIWSYISRTLTEPGIEPEPGIDAAGVRAAVGLATANLDTQLADLPTNAELATALAAADDAILAAVAALNNLSQANVRTAVGLASANLDTQLGDLPTAIESADALLKRDLSAVTGEATRSMLNALRFLRNKWSISGAVLTVTKEDDATAAWTASVTTAAVNPVQGLDPS